MALAAYRRKLRIWETNFGRDAGWYVERHGQRVALLIDPRSVGLFWDSYLLIPTTDDTGLRHGLQADQFWNYWTAEGVVFRSREFGTIARYALPAANPLREEGRIVMRGLYVATDWPKMWDWPVLWCRGW